MTRTVPNTTPYAWPWNGALAPARTALLVVTPTHGPALDGTEAGRSVSALARGLARAGGRVIQVVTLPPPSDADADAVALPHIVFDDAVVAAGVDGFYGSRLDPLLRQLGVDTLLLSGVGLETCIHSTMRSANDRGLECLLVIDACVAYRADLVAASRSQIEMSGGIFGAVGTTDDMLAALAAIPAEPLLVQGAIS